METALAIVDRLISIAMREELAARGISDPLLVLRYEMTIAVLRMVRDELAREV